MAALLNDARCYRRSPVAADHSVGASRHGLRTAIPPRFLIARTASTFAVGAPIGNMTIGVKFFGIARSRECLLNVSQSLRFRLELGAWRCLFQRDQGEATPFTTTSETRRNFTYGALLNPVGWSAARPQRRFRPRECRQRPPRAVPSSEPTDAKQKSAVLSLRNVPLDNSNMDFRRLRRAVVREVPCWQRSYATTRKNAWIGRARLTVRGSARFRRPGLN